MCGLLKGVDDSFRSVIAESLAKEGSELTRRSPISAGAWDPGGYRLAGLGCCTTQYKEAMLAACRQGFIADLRASGLDQD
jgi:hypothetical protein